MKKTGAGALLRYGALGVPLAFAGLPVYVHVPGFYAQQMGFDLAALGFWLLVVRLADAFIDPVIGHFSDVLARYRGWLMAGAGPLLAAGYVMLFSPPDGAGFGWLLGSLGLVYLGFSTLMINYYAFGTLLAEDTHGHTRVAAFRESAMLIGVLLASALPAVLMEGREVREAYHLFALSLLPLLLVGLGLALSVRPEGVVHEGGGGFGALLRSAQVRWVLFIGFCNAIPGAITSTLFLFFTADVLKVDAEESGLMLVVYFLSAAAGMPLWNALSRRVGKAKCLMLAMGTAIGCFIWAYGLGEGDVAAFYIICALSGMTLGADSMLMPSLMGDAIADKPGASASAFGLWNLTTKLTMAAAAGMTLPLLQAGGYQPGMESDAAALAALSMCYALLPCAFKAVAVVSVWVSPFNRRRVV